ncbi:MAG TPA: ABC transporter substrate-binding protein [Solirubrobacteraceae bacterium]
MKRSRLLRPRIAVAAAVLAGSLGALVAVGGSTATATATPPGGWITNFVQYAHGKPGAANPKLKPAVIGWSSNNSGGTVVSVGPEASAAAELAVKWINKYADGIDGHPLELDQCIVKNAEEEGLGCAQGFLNNKNVDVISFGALSVGAQTIDHTVNGKKPIIQGFSLNNSDVITPNEYILFAPGPFAVYGIAQYAKQYLKAKTAAIIYPAEAGLIENAQGLKLTDTAAGITSKLVSFSPDTTDLTGALTAAGAQTAGYVMLDITDSAQCLAAAKAATTLGINPNKVIEFDQCDQPTIKSQYPGGDYPHWTAQLSQSGDPLIKDPTGTAMLKAFTQFGQQANINDDWYSGMWGQIFTIAQFMNEIGYNKLSPAAITAKAKAFKGPLLEGGALLHCGKYRSVPAACSDGNYFFKYEGNGAWNRVSGWTEPPPALQKELEQRPFNSGFPAS